MSGPTVPDIPALARCLARPVRRAWLPLPVAEAVLLLAALRSEHIVADALRSAADAQALLRQAATP